MNDDIERTLALVRKTLQRLDRVQAHTEEMREDMEDAKDRLMAIHPGNPSSPYAIGGFSSKHSKEIGRVKSTK